MILSHLFDPIRKEPIRHQNGAKRQNGNSNNIRRARARLGRVSSHNIILGDRLTDPHSVIFVHGLQGDPVETWSTLVPPNPRLGGRLNPFRLRQRSKSQETSYGDSDTEGSNVIFWPDAFLKTDLLHVRIATAGYTSEVLGFFSATGQNNIMQHAQNLVADLQREREVRVLVSPYSNLRSMSAGSI